MGHPPVYSYSIANGSGSGYDPVGNILNYTDSVTGTWSMANSYDSLNRLTGAAATAGPFYGLQASWSYDSFGNRLGENFTLASGYNQNMPAVPTASTASYTAANRIQSSSLMLGGAHGYDAAGDIVQDNLHVYAYDGEGRVCAVASAPLNGGSGVTEYLYDAEGTRVAKGTAYPVLASGVYVLSCDTTANGFAMTNSYILGQGNEQLTELKWSGGAPYFDHTNVYAAGAGLIATYDTANYPSSYPWQVARSKSVKMCAAIDEAVPCSSRFCDERA